MDYDLTDKLIIKGLKSAIKRTEMPQDVYETPDNIAMDLACLYHVLGYFMVRTDYEAFVEKRRTKRNKRVKK
jgi:hypothetical protein